MSRLSGFNFNTVKIDAADLALCWQVWRCHIARPANKVLVSWLPREKKSPHSRGTLMLKHTALVDDEQRWQAATVPGYLGVEHWLPVDLCADQLRVGGGVWSSYDRRWRHAEHSSSAAAAWLYDRRHQRRSASREQRNSAHAKANVVIVNISPSSAFQ